MKIKDIIMTTRSRSERTKKNSTHQTSRQKNLVVGKKPKAFEKNREKKCDTEKSNKPSKRF